MSPTSMSQDNANIERAEEIQEENRRNDDPTSGIDVALAGSIRINFGQC